MYKTAAEINLSCLKANMRAVKARCRNIKICAALKADAYGHGAVRLAVMLEKEKLADYFGVANIEEGAELRKAGIKTPVLLFSLINTEEIDEALANRLTITVCDHKFIELINRQAEKFKLKTPVHIKTDTGMGRIGCTPEAVPSLAQKCLESENILLEGLYTHFPEADIPDSDFTREQIRIFTGIIKTLAAHNIRIPVKHTANSGAILNFPESYFDMVRPGIMFYGYNPSPQIIHSAEITPAMSLKSEIIFLKKLTMAAAISYGRTYTGTAGSYIATIPAGYADGINRLLSGNHHVKINGKYYPVAGRICMDQFMVDLGNDFYPVGTPVYIFDNSGNSAAHVARRIQTIPYEVLCAISKRVKRIYQD